MKQYLIATVIADDRPGIVEQLAATVRHHGGNWLESSMSRLAGKFAGILRIDISEGDEDALRSALSALDAKNIKVHVETSHAHPVESESSTHISLVANDRPGIVGEISQALANARINVVSLETYCDSAPMSAEMLFHALIEVDLPTDVDEDRLMTLLEALAPDLMVEVGDIDDLFE